MIHKLPDNVVEYLEDREVVCAVCGEPLVCDEYSDVPGEYDCVWADELVGVMHEGCAEQEIAYLEDEKNCQICVNKGRLCCLGFSTATHDCFESRYK